MTHVVVSRSKEPVLQVDQLGKHYRTYASPKQRLLSLLLARRNYTERWVLRDVSFSLLRGQCLGVVGNNGAGKSSLLKLITGTLQPSQGRVNRIGRVTAILELGAGFHPDFTGRQNLFFGGSLIGIDEARMHTLVDEILAFSELGEAIDRPVKTYSSGMVVRLAFALVTAVEPDVLIIDEALAVGDQHFQKKCIDRIEAFRRNGCTILFCSHSLYHIRHLCDVALWLDAGQVKAYGDTETVLAGYEEFVRQQDTVDAEGLEPAHTRLTPQKGASTELSAPPDVAGVLPRTQSGRRAEIVSVEVDDLGDGAPPLLQSKDLELTVTARVDGGEMPNFGIMLEQANGRGITAVVTHETGVKPERLPDGLWRIRLTFTELPLFSGEYVLSVYLFDATGMVVYEEWLKCQAFRVVYPSRVPGLVRLPHRWG